MSGPWTLRWGIHRGTLMSRDTGEPKQFDTVEECRTEAARIDESFIGHGWGYRLWFATAHGPDGESVNFPEFNRSYS